jgi:membrane associated rhomboid family serine protease
MSITVLIIVVTAGLSVWAWNNASIMYGWVLNPYDVVSKNQYYRMLTSGFLHADWGHLIFNMVTLYAFGGVIEYLFGQFFGPLGGIYLLCFYLAGIIVSDIPTLLKHRRDPGYNSLGASGGVSSIVFASILFSPLQKIYIFFIPVGIPGFIFGGLYLAYSYYESRQNRGTVNHDAHFYGALFGIVCMILVYPPVLPNFIEQIAGWRFF